MNNHYQLRYLGKGLQGFGIFKADPTWDSLFDEIERRRDAQNVKHFELLLPKTQIAHWIDDKPI